MYNDLRFNSCLTNNRNHQNDDRRSKHSKCTCCPYGYHIDLDFVRYCESLELDSGDHDTAAFRRRERRRQRQSMEVLLGLNTPANTPQPIDHQKSLIINHNIDYENKKDTNNIEKALEDVVSDFERTLASHKYRPESSIHHHQKSNFNKWDNTDGFDFSGNSSNSAVPVTPALQTIREQMALSLQKMRRLEEQVQAIPRLEFRITALRDVNQILKAQLKKCEEQLEQNKKRNNETLLKRDAAVTCSVITREIGTGTYQKIINENTTQTPHPPPKATKASQTHTIKPHTIGTATQCNLQDTSILYIAEKRDVSTQIKPSTHTIGINVKPKLVDTFTMPQYQKLSEISQTNSPISLHSITFGSRSKSFNLGESSSPPPKREPVAPTTRSQASQYTLTSTISKNTQTVAAMVVNQVSQYETPIGTFVSRGSQGEKIVQKSKQIDTEGLEPDKIDECIQCNIVLPSPTTSLSTPSTPTMMRRDSLTSKIPRPQTLVQTPPSERRLKRQITYTKIAVEPTVTAVQSNPTTPVNSQPVTPKEPLTKYNNKPLSVSMGPEAFTFTSLDHLSESNYLSDDDDRQRQKATPSKEMRAAMKVVNDFLLKNSNKNNGSHLKNARNIIQQEWFKVSSIVTANPFSIEDYMDSMEEFSNELLHYVVNMIDNSGNTAMHYAVSHGNFDVVSILLDSKVCDINRPNSAGYTPIMLLSLAEVRSASHSNVIRRLFQLADVNVKAKQHGQTALMLAVSHGRIDMAGLLLEAGADVNIQDEDGSTALMCAAEHGHIEIVKLFLAQPDCDSGIADVDGSTALKIALEAGHRDIGVLLYAHERMSSGASPYASLHRKKSQRSKPASPKLPRSPSATGPSTAKT